MINSLTTIKDISHLTLPTEDSLNDMETSLDKIAFFIKVDCTNFFRSYQEKKLYNFFKKYELVVEEYKSALQVFDDLVHRNKKVIKGPNTVNTTRGQELVILHQQVQMRINNLIDATRALWIQKNNFFMEHFEEEFIEEKPVFRESEKESIENKIKAVIEGMGLEHDKSQIQILEQKLEKLGKNLDQKDRELDELKHRTATGAFKGVRLEPINQRKLAKGVEEARLEHEKEQNEYERRNKRVIASMHAEAIREKSTAEREQRERFFFENWERKESLSESSRRDRSSERERDRQHRSHENYLKRIDRG